MKSTALHNWLILHLAPKFSSASWQQLLASSLTPAQLCAFDEKQLSNLGLKTQTINAILHPNRQRLDQIYTWLEKKQNHIITLTDPNYPPLLATIPGPPPLLYVEGNLQTLHAPQIAIVGSRNPTYTGLDLATRFAQELADNGLTITSGLASGIDSAAHLGALNTPATTIAVLGSGTNYIYPKKNSKLAAKIRETGCIVSEFPPNTAPKPYQFLQRNRIISGLSLGTLVVEAAQRSGSLTTARLAGEQGREVFAIPGSILNKMAHGCLNLIQQGAKLTLSIADILQELNIDLICNKTPSPPPPNQTKLDHNELKLLECIGFDITHFEQLMDRTGLPPQKISAMLCNLQLTGYIREEMGGYSRVLL